MNKAVCFIISVTSVALCAMAEDINPNAISGRDVNIALQNLDELISRRETYISSRHDKARTLRETFFEADTDSATKIKGYLLLGDINSTFCVDSALVCYYNGLHCSRMLHQDSLANIFRMRLASTLPVGGFIKEANEQFMEIDTTGMS